MFINNNPILENSTSILAVIALIFLWFLFMSLNHACLLLVVCPNIPLENSRGPEPSRNRGDRAYADVLPEVFFTLVWLGCPNQEGTAGSTESPALNQPGGTRLLGNWFTSWAPCNQGRGMSQGGAAS